MYDRILEEIESSDMVLVGVGAEASYHNPVNLHVSMNQNDWKKMLQEVSNEQEALVEFYNNLIHVIEKKNYFVITTNVDGAAFESTINPIRLVAPCGDLHKMQCKCEGLKGIISASELDFEDDGIKQCPDCHAEYVPNIYNPDYYNEEGYLKQWNLYNKWLQGTLNKKLFVLEIGCDFSFLSIIRMPFEKIVLINQKASYCRVSEKFPQITAELKDRMFSVEENPLEFAKKLAQK